MCFTSDEVDLSVTGVAEPLPIMSRIRIKGFSRRRHVSAWVHGQHTCCNRCLPLTALPDVEGMVSLIQDTFDEPIADQAKYILARSGATGG
jgi:hypothetical protein